MHPNHCLSARHFAVSSGDIERPLFSVKSVVAKIEIFKIFIEM